ncbi:hydantoinase B/oxoprolinase family protein [Pigmentiphaga soli]|uniref:Hydantoinase B/oxoprolinase family protein n=1 Tax=Pigmentiphaga soli TaxID=1007095 RepID=A0ABP8GTB9_9BURK
MSTEIQALSGHDAAGQRLFDPIGMEVFSNRLLTITEEMGNNLIRSSFSSNIKERKDCSVGLFDYRGRLIAQASHIPLHLGSLSGGVNALLEAVALDAMQPGDAFISNDPYLAGGTHMPDITLIEPVFWDGKVQFFAANIAHHSDVGGSVPGSISGGARSVFEEGLRIPVMRIVQAGELDESLLAMIAHNSREPEERTLDIKVQIAVNQRGGLAMRQLIGQMGLDKVHGAIDDLILYTRRRLLNRVRALKPGSHSFATFLDDDGLGDGGRVKLHVTVKVDGETIRFDFSNSGKQARGAMNIPLSALQATVYYCVKALLDPDLMPNSGAFDAVQIETQPGTIVSPRFPAPVGARSITCQKVAGAIFGAFRGLLPPERVYASANDVLPAMVFSGALTRASGTYVYLETLGGGAGAGYEIDGMDGIQVHVSNTANLPIEALENEYPLLVDEYTFIADSGGAGKWRGGMGLARQIRALQDGTIFSARSDGHVNVAQGVFGGADGRPGRLILNPGRETEASLPSKISHLVLKKGDSVRIETPGGAGYGRPSDRATALLARDIREGKVSREVAQAEYGPMLWGDDKDW